MAHRRRGTGKPFCDTVVKILANGTWCVHDMKAILLLFNTLFMEHVGSQLLQCTDMRLRRCIVVIHTKWPATRLRQ